MAHEDTLVMLQDSLARYLEDCHGFEARLSALRDADTAPPPFWPGLARELDLLRAALPEAQGGLGLGLAAHLAIMETLGASLAAQPYLATMVLGAGLLQRHPGAAADALLEQVVAGRAVLAFAHGEAEGRHSRSWVQTRLARDGEGWRLDGRKAVVHAAPWASHFIVSARSAGAPEAAQGVSLLLVPRDTPGLSLRAYPLRDGDRAAELAFDDVRLPATALLGEAGAALPQIEQALDEATLAVCAESLGVLRRLLRDTLDYVRQRKQFGAALSSFQVVQHRLADMHMALEQAIALTGQVGERLAAGGLTPAERARAVSSAKVAASKACKAVGQGAVQLHGGMGMTEELAVGHYMRRATLIEGLFGPVSWHLRRVADLAEAAA
ncbi:acyl-CoA dehydrogenase family protein [Pseudorhodoferax sp. Leaf265]|uniref:acyl-CoA dehydrogenase family protein n=1 Tax=Pseudorhodoferax sp. Leaf265 TaxID=1736315 RepID=UPI0006F220EE|nr:acyl-CoA dehydrogenase family protein [Pseudorhodoferax sp. Leaf265]KQP03147.1 pimeloyl-CoA dehydrogenase small subunit [Pseudorhodoferax sp. Leaf265]PZP95432.1 MAG: pimeloyl-CoA dehydrogenase small subunit [Variovorax paradoxus]PZQ06203.1 MAG: pimeloyl-CoA dehydrogenase small subunit [Variovorax paradoxus]